MRFILLLHTMPMICYIFQLLAVGILVASIILKTGGIPNITTETKPVLDLLTFNGATLYSYPNRISSLYIAVGVIGIVVAIYGLVVIYALGKKTAIYTYIVGLLYLVKKFFVIMLRVVAIFMI